jgi:hypothetical protein
VDSQILSFAFNVTSVRLPTRCPFALVAISYNNAVIAISPIS